MAGTVSSRASFGISAVFTLAARDRCLSKLKKINVPAFRGTNDTIPSISAAVLVPLCKIHNLPSLLYTVRSSALARDSYNVSFPGGKSDKGETPEQTALRETKEEIGLSPSRIEVWGHGPTIPGRGNKMMITPVIGAVDNLEADDLCVNSKEVREVFTVPLATLCKPENQFHTQFQNGFIMPVFVVENYKIWGMTAFITHVFLSSLLTKDVYTNDWMKRKIVLDDISESL